MRALRLCKEFAVVAKRAPRTPCVRGSRRGELSFMLSRLIDIVFSVLVIFLIVVITVALWNALHGTDKRVENQYNLVGDMLQGVIESPSEGVLSHRQFLFNFEVKDNRPTFDGTIFGISSDGSWTTPIPPVLWFPNTDGVNPMTGKDITDFVRTHKVDLSLSSVRRSCPIDALKEGDAGKQACICLSDVPLTKQDDLTSALNGIYECRSYNLPQGKLYLMFDFEHLQQQGVEQHWLKSDTSSAYADGQYPVVYLVKRTGGCPSDMAIPGTPSSKLTPENSVCVYASLQPDFTG